MIPHSMAALSYRSGFATSASASAPVASVRTCAQPTLITLSGGVSPGGASAGPPKSTTTATRFVPSFFSTPPQIPAKSGATDGRDVSLVPWLSAKRKPIASPSAGRAVAGPCVAYAQGFPPPLSQNDQ